MLIGSVDEEMACVTFSEGSTPVEIDIFHI